MRLKSQRGMGLVGILIGMAILSILLVSMMTVTINSMQVSRSIRQSNTANSTRQGINMLLNSVDACADGLGRPTLGNNWAGPTDLDALTFGGQTMAKKSVVIDELLTNAITLAKLQGPWDVQVNVTPAGPSPTMKAFKSYGAMLTLAQDKQDNGSTTVGGKQMKLSKFYAILTVDDTGKLYSCYGGSQYDMLRDICVRQLGGQWDDSKNPSCLVGSLVMAGSFAGRDTLRTNTLDKAKDPTVPNVGLAVDGPVWLKSTNPVPLGTFGAGILNVTNAYAAVNTTITPPGPTYAGIFETLNGTSQIMISGKGMPSGTQSNIAILKLGGPARDAGHTGYLALTSGGGDLDNSLMLGVVDPGFGNTNGLVLTNTGFALTPVALGVGFADAPVGTAKLFVNGDANISGNVMVGGTVTAASDEKLKTDVHAVTENVLDLLTDLVPVRFRWKRESFPDSSEHISIIAQKLEQVFPELVRQDPKGFRTVDFNGLTTLLVKAVNDLRRTFLTENEKLRVALDTERSRTDRLELENRRLVEAAKDFESRISSLEHAHRSSDN